MFIIVDKEDDSVFPHEFETFVEAKEFLLWNLENQNLDINLEKYEIKGVNYE